LGLKWPLRGLTEKGKGGKCQGGVLVDPGHTHPTQVSKVFMAKYGK